MLETWPRHADIAKPRRYIYGYDDAGSLVAGEIVRWYRRFDYVLGPTPIMPVVAFPNGRREYVDLGRATERYWIGFSYESVQKEHHDAHIINEFPQAHQVTSHGFRLHPANPWHVDPDHFLIYYGEIRGRSKFFGRVVGWDPPHDENHVPDPLVRIVRYDGVIKPEVLAVGSVDAPSGGYRLGATIYDVRDALWELEP